MAPRHHEIWYEILNSKQPIDCGIASDNIHNSYILPWVCLKISDCIYYKITFLFHVCSICFEESNISRASIQQEKKEKSHAYPWAFCKGWRQFWLPLTSQHLGGSPQEIPERTGRNFDNYLNTINWIFNSNSIFYMLDARHKELNRSE